MPKRKMSKSSKWLIVRTASAIALATATIIAIIEPKAEVLYWMSAFFLMESFASFFYGVHLDHEREQRNKELAMRKATTARNRDAYFETTATVK